MKKCIKCNTEKNIDLFNKKYGKPQSVCKECHSIYRKNHYQLNKEKYINKAKLNKEKYKKEFLIWLSSKECLDCGNSDIRVLEFDHLYNKSFNISSMIGQRKLDSFMDEIFKCDVVCANCHRIRTVERGEQYRSNVSVYSLVVKQ